ncbi:MAG: hypothetical protein ACQERN_12185 [Thermodesulfobacteriota bacterium]
MDQILRDVVIAQIESSRKKRVAIETIVDAARRQAPGYCSDFELRDRLLIILKALAGENRIRLPATARCWDRKTGLPQFVTAVREAADAEKQRRKQLMDELRFTTAWEPTRMVSFAHTLKDVEELKRAKRVNTYLLTRNPETKSIPHRERALAIFGDEKALDRYVRQGLFNGRITLADLDCFYCPEPLPFRPFSMDRLKTRQKPLLVVENACTYWSCCHANATSGAYAAVVYGQGFQACATERASDGLMEIETRLAAHGIAYFGDLDPAGIDIPLRINAYRREKQMMPLYPATSLYRVLLYKDLSVTCSPAHAKFHDAEKARQWLGNSLATTYLEKAPQIRWPQEGMTANDIINAMDTEKVH